MRRVALHADARALDDDVIAVSTTSASEVLRSLVAVSNASERSRRRGRSQVLGRRRGTGDGALASAAEPRVPASAWPRTARHPRATARDAVLRHAWASPALRTAGPPPSGRVALLLT